jgi:hypothetical protein
MSSIETSFQTDIEIILKKSKGRSTLILIIPKIQNLNKAYLSSTLILNCEPILYNILDDRFSAFLNQ